MSERYAGLKKIPDQPAKRLMAANNAKIKTQLEAPASASVPTVLAELEEHEAWVDIIRILSVSLPPREAVWWACLAGRDLIGPDKESLCLKAAEAWVFEPNDANRKTLHQVLENESSGDKAAMCATAAYYAPGTLGLGDMAEYPAPTGVVASCSFGVNLKTVKLGPDPKSRFQLIIDRAVDIARGGNGNVELAEPKSEGAA